MSDWSCHSDYSNTKYIHESYDTCITSFLGKFMVIYFDDISCIVRPRQLLETPQEEILCQFEEMCFYDHMSYLERES